MGTYFVGSNYTFSVFAYEGFSYTISNPDPGTYTLGTVSNSVGFGPTPSAVYFTKNGNNSYTFGVSDLSNNLTPGTTESFVISANGLVSSNIVSIGAGRFLDGSGNNLSNTSYTFYKNEPITPVRFVAPSFKLKQPLLAIPALPPGLSFASNASNIYDLTGTPLVTVPTSNYQIIGVQDGGSKIVTTRINMTVSNERLRVDLSGSPIVGNMQIGTSIGSRVFTVRPPSGTTSIRYTYPTFPDGIVVRDINGITQTGTSFAPSDPSYTMIITGAPTSNAAYSFRDAGVTATGVTYPIQVTRTSPLPIVESSQALTFAFGETVLFDLSAAPTLYNGIPVDPSAVFFRAATYFGGSVNMSDIFSPDLRSDLSLTFVPSLSRANLTGTPSSAGSGTYTIRAINSNGTTREYSLPITVSNDSVTFSSPVGVDLCYNFILSRPVDQAKTGYYPSNIQFVASAASRLPVTLSAPALTGTGLALDSNGVIIGTPTAVTAQTDLIVTATVSGSPATGSKTVKFAVLNDAFTFADICSNSLNFIQNVASTPFQVQATSLSGRGIIGFAQTGLPDGVTISPAGIVSGTPNAGTPTAGNVTFTATTGYASGTRDFSYNLTPDSVLITSPQTTYSYTAGDAMSIDFDGVSYSGTAVSNYATTLSPGYGPTMNSTTGLLSGTWSTGIPPAQAYPPIPIDVSMSGQAGTLVGTSPFVFSASPVVQSSMLFGVWSSNETSGNYTGYAYTTDPNYISLFTKLPLIDTEFYAYTDTRARGNDPTNNAILSVNNAGLGYIGTRLNDLSSIPFGSNNPNIVANIPGTSTWWVAGAFADASGNPRASVVKTTDDGQTFGSPVVLQTAGGFEIFTRDSNGLFARPDETIPYTIGGLAFAYKDGVLMAGGVESDTIGKKTRSLRSTDDGATWQLGTVALKEIAAYNFDDSDIWIAVGSSEYKTSGPIGGDFASTIQYSVDQGENWNGVTGDFNTFAYDIAYGNNMWIATGVNYSGGNYTPQLRYSTDGGTWTAFDLSSSPVVASSATFLYAPIKISRPVFDGNYWNVMVNQDTVDSNGIPTIYRHDASSSLASGWFAVDVSSSLPSNIVNPTLRFTAVTPPKYLYTGTPPTKISLTSTLFSGTGPTITSPLSTSYLQYQYVPIAPIQLSATGTGTVYFFASAAALPPGLTFNQFTNQITGTCVEPGTVSFIVYAKDDLGVSSISLTFTTIIPRIIRKQDGAGAYTSLLRQYTEVLGAQNARDSRVYPTQESKLGEFMSPEAPDVITQTVDPSCFGPSNCP